MARAAPRSRVPVRGTTGSLIPCAQGACPQGRTPPWCRSRSRTGHAARASSRPPSSRQRARPVPPPPQPSSPLC
eukprot:619008-Prymnesium_polylepis.1